MSEPIPSLPPGGRAAPGHSAGIGGKLLAVLCWIAFAGALAVLAAACIIHFEHRAEADRRDALDDEQRAMAAAVTDLARHLAAESAPAPSGVATLRTDSLDLVARTPPGPAAEELYAEWGRLVAALDAVEADWPRVLEARTEIDGMRSDARALEDATARLADGLSRRPTSSFGPAGRDVLRTAALLFRQEAEGVSLLDTAGLDRAAELLGLLGHARGLLVAEVDSQPAVASVHAELAAVDAQLGANRARVERVRGLVEALSPTTEDLRRLTDASATVTRLLPGFEAPGRRSPTILGLSLDDWLLRSAAVAVIGLLGLVWRRQRLAKAGMAALDRAWVEAAESDWRARSLVLELVRAVGSLGPRGEPPAGAASMRHDDLDESVRDATRALPRIVAQRARLAAALLAAREPLRRNLSAARDSVLGSFDAGSARIDAAPLLELEATFREATLFALAALAGEIRAVVSERAAFVEASEPDDRNASTAESIRDLVARGFELIERGLERSLDGEEGEPSAALFLIDDLRTARGGAPISTGLEVEPEPGGDEVTRPTSGPFVRREAARMLPSFQKGLQEWTGADTDGSAAARLIRGSVAVVAHSVEEAAKTVPERGFWSVAAAFCTALSENAVPSGPAVHRILKDLEGELARVSEDDSEAPPPAGLFRDLLAYVALAECDHPEVQAVRDAFDLDRHELSIPHPPIGDDPGRETREVDVSGEIIQQLEGIRAALDRINRPGEEPSGAGPRD